MKVQVLILLTAILLFDGCFLNKLESVQHIVKDFNLGWQGDPDRQALFVNIDHEEYGGLKVVDQTVFAIAWDQDFIIALQYPNISEIIPPNEPDTIYHIVDIREYTERFWGPKGNVYRFDTKTDYLVNKRKMGVPELVFKRVGELKK